MSRLALTTAFLLSLTSLTSLVSPALAARAYVEPAAPAAPRWAQPPQAEPIAPDAPDVGRPADVLTRAAVRAALVERRAANLAAFDAYRATGVFPSNTFAARKLNVWQDRDGHLCAAATMINASDPELVARVAEQNNFIRLADVTTGPLMDWILTSGLTQAEVVMIQEPFMPVAKPARPVEARRRAIEDRRLLQRYAVVARKLHAQDARSLERAVDLLMAHPQLAWSVL